MLRYANAIILIILCAGLSGCGSTRYGMKTYSDDKARIDQSQLGNQGYLAGAPDQDELSMESTTRKVYGVEVTQTEGAPRQSPVGWVMETDDWMKKNWW